MPALEDETDIPAIPREERVVYVIDDHSEMRKSLHFLLSTLQSRSWPFVSGKDFFEQQPQLSAAPILLDIRMPGMDGFEVLAELARRKVDWPVVVMTGHGDIAAAVRAMKLGAIEFLEKPFEVDALEVALTSAFEIEARNRQGRLRRAEAQRLLEQLTRREAEVIEGIVQGLPNKIVAHQMGLSPRTVEMHRANAMSKLGVRNVAEVAKLAAWLNAGSQDPGPTAASALN